MSNKRDFKNGCFSPNWLEVDLSDAKAPQNRKDEVMRKDLDTLLKELDEIKRNIEWVEEKQLRLNNLMSFYREEPA